MVATLSEEVFRDVAPSLGQPLPYYNQFLYDYAYVYIPSVIDSIEITPQSPKVPLGTALQLSAVSKGCHRKHSARHHL